MGATRETIEHAEHLLKQAMGEASPALHITRCLMPCPQAATRSGHGVPPGATSIRISVPADKAGLIIGRGLVIQCYLPSS